ncbi:MAG: NAD(P)H-dependent oxidoreductase [Chitinophaga sp.]|uniref:NAD(P)H-dependent oxidoreductase n=1 Tax=Chitinophaga sp. TaxID=1869181 RepID=UPI001B138AF9|nr:NAD(P)H-dependent oxidoreductase [Chitinophaga sp.]MBO9731389.1 NAD(P)H-dependent oxidoreductase [Chitinophaga sp.]
MKKILIIQGNPHPGSYCSALATTYQQTAGLAGHQAELIHLYDLNFDLSLRHGYRQRTEWEPDLHDAWAKIQAADHLVWIYPIWWGTAPALLKGFIDRVFLPGKTFKYRSEKSVFWDKLLKHKSARMIVTMDSPAWYDYMMYGRAGIRAMKTATLAFCGLSPVKVTVLDKIKLRSPQALEKCLRKIERLALKGK